MSRGLFARLKQAHRQTKFLILMAAIYMIALIWTTLQAYARLEYSRSTAFKPIIIHAEEDDSKKS